MSDSLFLQNLRYLRKTNKITQNQMAEKLDMARSTYAYFENNTKLFEQIEKLRFIVNNDFGYTLDELLIKDLEAEDNIEEQAEKAEDEKYEYYEFLIDSFCACLSQISSNLKDIKYELLL